VASIVELNHETIYSAFDIASFFVSLAIRLDKMMVQLISFSRLETAKRWNRLKSE